MKVNLKKQQVHQFLEYAVTALVAVIFVVQMFSLSTYLGRSATHNGVLYAVSSDGGSQVESAVRTKWWNDNGYRGYGPLYMRLAHTLALFKPLNFDHGGAGGATLDAMEKLEIQHHYTLMLVSLLSLYGLCLFLMSWVTENWAGLLAGTIFLMAVFQQAGTFAEGIINPHPDLLFSFLLALAWGCTYKFLHQTTSKKLFRLSAFLWGIVAASKLTIVIFAPAFIFLFVPPLNKKSLKNIVHYTGWVFAGYFAIGFPQTLVIWKEIKFLIYQNGFSEARSWASLMDWGERFKSFLLPTVPATVALWLLLNDKKPKALDYKILLRWASIIIIPLVYMTTKNITAPRMYYPFPFIVPLLVLLICLLKKSSWSWHNKIWLHWGAPLILLVASARLGLTSDAFNRVHQKFFKCKTEFLEIYDLVKAKQKEGKRVLTSPYTPFSRTYREKVWLSWENTFKEVERFRPHVILLNNSFYHRFTYRDTADPYVAVDSKDYKGAHFFYKTFEKKEAIQDPWGRRWVKKAEKCRVEFWERES